MYPKDRYHVIDSDGLYTTESKKANALQAAKRIAQFGGCGETSVFDVMAHVGRTQEWIIRLDRDERPYIAQTLVRLA